VRGRPPIPVAAQAEIVRLYADGVPSAEVAARVGVSERTVLRYAGEGRVARRPGIRRARVELTAEIVRLRDQGLRPTEVARRVGRSTATVYAIPWQIVPRTNPGAVAARKAEFVWHRAEASRRAAIERSRPRCVGRNNNILDAWADGLSQYDPSLLTGRSDGAIRQLVARGRRDGDPRVAPRGPVGLP